MPAPDPGHSFLAQFQPSGTTTAVSPSTPRAAPSDPGIAFLDQFKVQPASASFGDKANADTLAALPYTNTADDRRFRAQLAQVDPAERQRVLAQAQPNLNQRAMLRAEGFKRAADARARGDEETANALLAKLREDVAGVEPSGPIETVKKGAGTLFRVLDAPHHLLRQVTTAAFGDNPHGLYEKDIPGDVWAENVRKTADAGGAKGALARAALLLPDVAGGVVGGALGTAVAGVGALSDIAAGRTPTVENAWQTIKDTAKDASNVALQMETDPLSFVSVGAPGAAKSASTATLRGALRAGVSAGAAEELAKSVGAAMAQHAGTPDAARHVVDLFKNQLPEQGEALARSIFGKDLEFLGRGQLQVHAPFMSHKGIDVLPALGAEEFAAGKAVQKVADPVLGKLGRRGIFDQSAEQTLSMGRQARAAAALKEAEYNRALEEEMAKLPAGHRLHDPKVREEIRARYQEPSFTLRDATEASPAEHVWQLGDKAVEVVPREDWIRSADELDRIFGPGAKQYAEAMRGWHMDRAKELLDSGALEPGQLMFNPLSRRYMHRPYEMRIGPLEDMVDMNRFGGTARGTSMQKERQLVGEQKWTDAAGVEHTERSGLVSPDAGERLGYLKPKSQDPFEILPQYAKQAARAQAEEELRQRVASAFGRPLEDFGPGAKSPLRGAWSPPMTVGYGEGAKQVRIPAHVANILDGTFDKSLSTLAKAARRAGMETTPAGRAVVSFLDGYAGLAGRFKRLVLKTPAYHAVNTMDDIMKMSIDGMHNPLAWLRKADQVVRSPEAVLQIGGREVPAAQLLNVASKEGIGVNAAARFEEFGTRAATERLGSAALDSSGAATTLDRVKGGAKKLNDASSWFGEQWENRAKLMHFLWRLDAGDSPAQAASRTMKVLFDYGQRSKAEQIAGWLVPFIKYTVESPKATARFAVQNPGALLAMERAFQAMSGSSNPMEPKQFWSERGRPVELTDRGAQVAGNFRQALGGHGARAGLNFSVLPKLAPYEAFKPIEELLHGNVDPLVSMGGPMARAAMEYATEQDLLTKRPMHRPGLLSMFPAGSIAPTALQASADQMPWFSRNVPQYLASPFPLLAANYLINRAQPGGPTTTLGSSRPLSALDEPKDIYAQKLMQLLSGIPIAEVSPADRIFNLAHQPEIDAALRDSKAASKAKKVEREQARRR